MSLTVGSSEVVTVHTSLSQAQITAREENRLYFDQGGKGFDGLSNRRYIGGLRYTRRMYLRMTKGKTLKNYWTGV
jgi:hypothetical protein